MNLEFNITDNSPLVLAALPEAIERALEAIGQQVECRAKVELSKKPKRIDTGLLRNSITHAVSGKPPAISRYAGSSTHTAESDSVKKSELVGKPAPPPHTGTYSGQAPDEAQKAVWVGTNVEYATYVHDGRITPNCVPTHRGRF